MSVVGRVMVIAPPNSCLDEDIIDEGACYSSDPRVIYDIEGV